MVIEIASYLVGQTEGSFSNLSLMCENWRRNKKRKVNCAKSSSYDLRKQPSSQRTEINLDPLKFRASSDLETNQLLFCIRAKVVSRKKRVINKKPH